MRRSQPSRYWDDALLKTRQEGRCRACGVGGRIDCAHIIGRRYDRSCHDYGRADIGDVDVLYVHPDSVVPLCRSCHDDYDGRRLDLSTRLTVLEESWCVRRIGLERTLRRLRGGRAEDL
jgi:hypothetical protein